MQSSLLSLSDQRRSPHRAAALLAGSAVCLCLLALQLCEGAEFRVEGTIAITTDTHEVLNGTNVMRVHTGTFAVCTRSSSQWLIQVRRNQSDLDSMELGRDGGPVHEYVLAKSNAERQAARVGTKPLNDGLAEVRPGPVGNSHSSEEATILWWAFLSGAYLEERERTSDSRLPIIFTTDQRLRYFDTGMPCHWHRFRDPPFLPEQLDQKNEGFEYAWLDYDNEPYVMPPSKLRYPGLAGKGFTNVVYRVDATSNSSGLLLPARFHVDHYMQEGRPGENAVSACSLWRRFSFSVTNRCTEAGVASFIPRVLGITTVDDLRFALSEPRVLKVGYVATNRWLTDSEVKRLPEYAQTLRYQAGASARLVGPRPTSIVSKVLFWSSFAGSTLICLWLLLRRRQPVT